MQQAKAVLEDAIQCWETQFSLPKKKQRSVRKIAKDFEVPYTTLQNRISGKSLARTKAHEHRQKLNMNEEQVIVDYIARCSSVGHPASSSLVYEVANEIYHSKQKVYVSPDHPIESLGQSWVDKFKDRHPEVVSAWTKPMKSAALTVRPPSCSKSGSPN